jgi:ABC-type glycerol-3-phosphate transport system substrate-binding protein
MNPQILSGRNSLGIQRWASGPCRAKEQTSGNSAARAVAACLALTGPSFDAKVTRIAGSPTRTGSYSEAECARYPWLADQRAMLLACRTLPAAATRGPLLGALYQAIHRAFTGQVTPEAALAEAARAAGAVP